MSPWDEWDWPAPARKQPPPARGIRMKRAGTTWWGERWLAALERLSRNYASRLSRGRSYARAGRTHDLAVAAGVVTAQVTGTSATPYVVQLEVPVLTDATWAAAIDVMAGRASFAADLLAGHMPQEIDEAFAAAGASLFPERAVDLRTRCSCPDWANPCKHAAAVHYVLGEAFDGDPFLLFELRGRSKREVLDALRVAREAEAADSHAAGDDPSAGDGSAPRALGRDDAEGADVDQTRVRLPRMRADAYEAPRAPLPAAHSDFDVPAAGGALLRQLGTPSGWTGDVSPPDLFGPTLRAAAERARRLAE